MPVFIRKRVETVTLPDGEVEYVRKGYSRSQLKRLYAENPSLFIEVSESHAADVLRPQGNYQEVPDVEDESAHAGKHDVLAGESAESGASPQVQRKSTEPSRGASRMSQAHRGKTSAKPNR